jgi:RecA-family ATPase
MMSEKNIISLGDKLAQQISRAAIDPRVMKVGEVFIPPMWAIKGMIPEGVGVIAGSGGVGKTTCIVPLALAVAGFKSPSCNIDTEIQRKVIYVSEDPDQVIRIIQGMRKFLNWSDKTWADLKNNFLILDSVRMSIGELHDFLIETLPYGVVDPVFTLPLVVFDTTAANLAVINESDNSEVSEYMAIMKEHYSRHKASIWLVSHLTKTAKGQGVDDIMNLGARGAGAWNDNAHWTAVLSSDGENGDGNRVLKMAKRRADVGFDEIIFEGSVHQATGINRLGEEVLINYRYTVPRKSSQNQRITEKMEKRSTAIEDAIFKALEVLEYPSRKDIKELVKFRGEAVTETINKLILTCSLAELDLPKNIIKKGRSTYLGVPNETF